MRPTSELVGLARRKQFGELFSVSGVAQSESRQSREAKGGDTRRRPARSDNPKVIGSNPFSATTADLDSRLFMFKKGYEIGQRARWVSEAKTVR